MDNLLNLPLHLPLNLVEADAHGQVELIIRLSVSSTGGGGAAAGRAEEEAVAEVDGRAAEGEVARGHTRGGHHRGGPG